MTLNTIVSSSFLVIVATLVGVSCNGSTSSSGGGSGGAGENGGADEGGSTAAAGSSNGGTSSSTVPVDTTVPAQPWDWTGVIGSGQSLAVGQQGRPVLSTTPSYNNLKLATGTLAWPVDSTDATLEMTPLIEPVGRLSTAYPSSWPTNIAGETAHTSMASQVTSMVTAANGDDYVGVHGEFGENGQCMNFLVKGATEDGVNGRAYAATLVETEAVTRLATAEGKTYGVGALIMTHGECDAASTTYEEELYQLLSDYNDDIAAITGQTQKIQLIVSQQNSIGAHTPAGQAQWQIGVHHPTEAACSGPKYHLPYDADGIHLTAEGYRQLGEKYGQVYYERVVQGRNWQPLYPTEVERDGQDIIVHFHVPVAPLTWDATFTAPLYRIPQWQAGKGFEVSAGSTRYTISAVTLEDDAVRITCSDPLPDTGVQVGYAMTGSPTAMEAPHAGTFHWGLLKDSDPFVGSITGVPQPNYAVAFYLDVP